MKFQKIILVLLMAYIVGVSSTTPDINAAIKDVFSSLTNVELMMEEANEETMNDKPTGVSCGNHRRNTCAECPGNNGKSWCNGECKWRENQCIHKDVIDPDINCGNDRYRNTCAECPDKNGESWCNGDCKWKENQCIHQKVTLDVFDKGVSCGNHRRKTCAECPGNNGKSWCHGECQWKTNQCIPQDVLRISCGKHRRNTCAECPGNHGKSWCNGECKWRENQCIHKDVLDLDINCGNDRYRNTCAECPDKNGESECNGDCKWRDNQCKLFRDALDPDILDHDCTNVRKFKEGEFPKKMKDHPILARIKVNAGEQVTKWNHAYGIPVVAWDTQSDETVKRACYLIRYLFADNEWLRRYYYNQKFYFYGRPDAGTCCPPYMANQGLACRCNTWVPYSLTPAHEAAHQFLRSVEKATVDGKMKMPEFTNTSVWSYTRNPDMPQWTKEDPWKEFLWNSWKKDQLNKKTGWGFGDHYFLKSGQDQWLGLKQQGRLHEESRANKERNNPELGKMMKIFWPCNNSYVLVCKDAAYNYQAGPAQTLTIGKADPNDPTKMICRDDLDKPELSSRGDRVDPTDDDYHGRPGDSETAKQDNHATYCKRLLKDGGWITNKINTNDLVEGVVNEALREGNYEGGKDTERNWYIQHCCAQTAKFPYAMK